MSKIAYEPHPVTPERKAEQLAQGFRIIDARFKPADAEPANAEPAPAPQRRSRQPEQQAEQSRNLDTKPEVRRGRPAKATAAD